MSKKLLLTVALMVLASVGFSQTKEELQAQKKARQAEANVAQKKADSIQAIIDAMPGWRVGAFGTVGGSLSNFNNWYAQGVPNNSSGNIGITVNAYANLIEDKFFWRNSLNTNLSWVKLDDQDDPTDNDNFEPTTDVFNISSLYGRKLSENLAASGLMEYRTTLLDNFNDPGYLDVGIGGTWTPINNLIVVIHPLNYNFVFSNKDAIYESSLGAKIVADYTRQIGKINFKTNFSTFQSYKSSDLSNFTWTNSFSYTLWKNLGVGFDFALRSNHQEALDYAISQLSADYAGEPLTYDNVDNDLQTYYTVGLSYKF
ncbi:DUF3078 domain-containing protein [Sediminibacter sp. Hel_I_10]|uniref:DUF3078 domain-containing protein n=1 Tax=Sediminibacter sp. Hel_I_10 TaxID=1392490 RepID=UPI000479C71C|nr:DUF3078 domain-containing protein [Sediminibacter sp. Hel_I_10]